MKISIIWVCGGERNSQSVDMKIKTKIIIFFVYQMVDTKAKNMDMKNILLYFLSIQSSVLFPEIILEELIELM